MKKLSSILIIILLTFAVSAKAENSHSLLLNILSKTDSQMIPEAKNSMEIFDAAAEIVPSADNPMSMYRTAFLPDPIDPENKGEKITGAAMDFYPINKKIRYDYEYTSTDFLGTKYVIFEFANYSEKDNSVTVNVTITKGAKSYKMTYNLTLAFDGIYSTNSFLEGPRLEMPNSIYRGKAWTKGANKNWVSSVKSRVDIPAGHFENCVRIKTRIGDGDAGSAVRYYNRGIGLLYEEWQAEDKVETLRLLSYSLN
ncbi:MAG: hypothetical protein KAI33_06715 [Elusimicrobiales bacterium]|nr:hypothetical protein [Elusimicrobiales bacterium]